MAAVGLSCGTLAFLVEACKLLVAACGIYFLDQGSNLGPLLWECGVLATGLPENSLNNYFLNE